MRGGRLPGRLRCVFAVFFFRFFLGYFFALFQTLSPPPCPPLHREERGKKAAKIFFFGLSVRLTVPPSPGCWGGGFLGTSGGFESGRKEGEVGEGIGGAEGAEEGGYVGGG